MKKLDVNQMRDVSGGGDAMLCGVGIGLMIGTGFTGAGALVGLGVALLFCLSGDTRQE
jgi:hypothetical protein